MTRTVPKTKDCKACHETYLDRIEDIRIPYCPDCRPQHTTKCRTCRWIPVTYDTPGLICDCCRRQTELF